MTDITRSRGTLSFSASCSHVEFRSSFGVAVPEMWTLLRMKYHPGFTNEGLCRESPRLISDTGQSILGAGWYLPWLYQQCCDITSEGCWYHLTVMITDTNHVHWNGVWSSCTKVLQASIWRSDNQAARNGETEKTTNSNLFTLFVFADSMFYSSLDEGLQYSTNLVTRIIHYNHGVCSLQSLSNKRRGRWRCC